MTTHALDLARWLPTATPAPGEAVVVTGAPEPFDSTFVPIASGASVPSPTALGQVIQSEAVGQSFAWSAAVPSPVTAIQVALSPAVAGQSDVQSSTANLDARIATLNGQVEALTGVQRFVGALHAANAAITWTADSGMTGNAIPPAGAANQGWYLICDVDGSVPSTGAPLGPYISGDWVISDGIVWTHLNFGSTSAVASQVAVSPTIGGAADVQTALAVINAKAAAQIAVNPAVAGAADVQTALTNLSANAGNFLPLAGGVLLGPLIGTAANFAVSLTTLSLIGASANATLDSFIVDCGTY